MPVIFVPKIINGQGIRSLSVRSPWLDVNAFRDWRVMDIDYGLLREEEENNLPQMKKLFFLYVWLNLTRIAELRKEDLVKEIK